MSEQVAQDIWAELRAWVSERDVVAEKIERGCGTSWDTNGDATVGGARYRRITKEVA